MKKAVLLTMAVVLLVGFSGCLGGGGDAGPTTGGGGGGITDGGGDGGDGSDGGDGGGVDPVDDFEDVRNERQMADYIDRSPFPVYRPGEFFEYEGQSKYDPDADTGTLRPVTMTIESGNGGEWLEADLEVTLERGDRTVTFTEEDPEMMFTPEFSFTANGRSWIWLFRYNLVNNVDPRISELSVGDTWRYDGDDGTGLVFSVPREETYAGIDCTYVVTEQFDGDERMVFTESCVAPDVGLPLYFAQYDDEGLVYEVELVDYSR